MFDESLKRLAAFLPLSCQRGLKRIHYWNQIRGGNFVTKEPEYALMDEFISLGDWVVDIGANVGHYTKRFSDLVGKNGRVVALEPIPETFELLSYNVQFFMCQNVTLLNVAASDRPGVVGMRVPKFKTGLRNYYQAFLSESEPDVEVMAISIDSLRIPNCIRLVKIDAEGLEYKILNGMLKIIDRDHPTMIIEVGDNNIIGLLQGKGYEVNQFPESPNMVFKYSK